MYRVKVLLSSAEYVSLQRDGRNFASRTQSNVDDAHIRLALHRTQCGAPIYFAFDIQPGGLQDLRG
jgi:hypothetical protein